jgi:hypothetical protein
MHPVMAHNFKFSLIPLSKREFLSIIMMTTVGQAIFGVVVVWLTCLSGCCTILDIVMTKDERGITKLYPQNVMVTQVQINAEAEAFPREPVSEKYQDNGDGTITDIRTGLMWIRKPFLWLRWEDARDQCENIFSYPYQDWRLPTRVELATIIDIEQKMLYDTPDKKYFEWVRQSKYDEIWTKDVVDVGKKSKKYMWVWQFTKGWRKKSIQERGPQTLFVRDAEIWWPR